MNYLDTAKSSIENFSLNTDHYREQGPDSHFKLSGNFNNNQVLVKDESYDASFLFNFHDTCGCRVFVGSRTRGNISINFRGDNSLVYIGDNCDLKQLQIRSRQHNDFIAIGEEVSVAGNNVWISGYGIGTSSPAIIIGDDCMFSFDVIIRNTDAHPLFDADSDLQINEPQGAVHIEPHVWIGERSNILKDTTIGACSIIALGSTVTKDAPRYSIVKGVPAIASAQENNYWARDHSDFAIQQAKYYTNKYRVD